MSRKPPAAPGAGLPAVTISEHDGVRYLHLDSVWVQGAMRIAQPQRLELEYAQRMMAWMLWRSAAEVAQGHAVQLGLGAASLTRFCHKVLGMRTTAVEINPAVIQACRLWFRLGANDARLNVVHADALQWVGEPAQRRSVQVLNVDLYDRDAAAPVLDDEAFYAACHDALDDGGLMTVNLFGRNASFGRSAGRLARVFGAEQVWVLRPTREGNTVVVAARNTTVPAHDEQALRAAHIEARYGLPARKWLRMVRPLKASDLAGAPSA